MMGTLSVLVVVVCALMTSAVAATEDPVVTVEQGKVRGGLSTSRNGKQFYQFLGVPYGKIPVRFGLSEFADPWKDVQDATKSGPTCMQFNSFLSRVVGVEDCLILDVYTPKLPQGDAKLLPVMFWVHGGAYLLGSASEYGGKYWMDQDVVYVAINYRLGALGFLNAEIEGASGNQGLKDQVLALKWVKQNIKQFGGDPNQITIFGESAGGSSVSQLTLSPMSKGLFQNAISQSGTALCIFADYKMVPKDEAKQLATLLDCPTSDLEYMAKCLRGKNAHDIVGATKPRHLNAISFDTVSVPQFGPTVEKHQKDLSTVFMPEDPLTLLQQGNFNRVPWIVGTNEQEGIVVSAGPILMNATLMELLNKEWGRVAPNTFIYGTTARDPCIVSSAIKKFYFGAEDAVVSMDNRQALIDAYSDRYFVECTREAAQLYAKHAPVFLYNFTRKVEHSVARLFGWKDDSKQKVSSHADELGYFFNFPVTPFHPGIPKGNPEEEFSEKMIKLWISFAKNGRPMEWGSTNLNWSPVNQTDKPLKWMNIGQTDLQLQPENPDVSKRLDFWAKINSQIRTDNARF